MNSWFRGFPLCLVLLVGMLGAGLSLASVASAQEDAPAATEAADAADAGDTAAAPPAAEEPAAEAPATEEAAAAEEPAAEAATVSPEDNLTYTINTLFMFICAILVLFMQAGFAMVEVGLNSAKNTVNILAKNMLDLAVGVLLFLFVGYGLMYPGDAWIGFGGKEILGFSGSMVTRDNDAPNLTTTWGNSADFMFQVAFAATAATIVSGAVAGRMKFSAYLIYSAFITGLIYPISGSWKWGAGFLGDAGFQDFAGSVIVHAVGGFAGLAGAMLLGPRIGRYTADGKSVPIPGHNITFAALGVFILWVGWYGFNPGSQLTYFGWENAEKTTYIALTTTLAGAIGSVSALITAWILFGKPDLTMALNGALAGLVGITANCDRVDQPSALIIGAVAGVIVVLGTVMLDKLKIDDPVGAFPVHGLCGVWGGLATGIFGDLPEVDGATLTRGAFIGVQAYGTIVIVLWAFVTMLILFSVLKALGMLRVSAEDEQAGLDVSEHGMHAYPSDAVAGGAIH